MKLPLSGMRRSRGRVGWLRRQLGMRPLPLWIVITADVLALVLALLVFALFHHVLPRDERSTGIVSERAAMASPAPDELPEVAAEPTESPGIPAEPTASPAAAAAEAKVETLDPASLPEDGVGVFARRYADKFTTGAVIADSSGYQSPNLNITFTRGKQNNIVYYVADIYIRDIQCLRTCFAKDKFGRGHYEWLTDMCARTDNTVIGVNGDYCGGRSDGIVIRNGELFRDDKAPWRDVCALYWDGSMKIFSGKKWNTKAEMKNGCCQAWNFGPSLLDGNGQARTKFDSEVTSKNPRTAIGYFAPGHYCLVVVDGRSKQSIGATLPQLSRLMQELGCKCAYNLDGGQSSEMAVGGKTISKPAGGGRKNSDAILIIDG